MLVEALVRKQIMSRLAFWFVLHGVPLFRILGFLLCKFHGSFVLHSEIESLNYSNSQIYDWVFLQVLDNGGSHSGCARREMQAAHGDDEVVAKEMIELAILGFSPYAR
ncbi:hypothetical protein V8G54_002330 [Vigna mungo]|uniref:Uncharacterized protein n=1 Tax=Vigna mungo TaxID=3915 RepID=A0AAQ3P7X5_VIGMU